MSGGRTPVSPLHANGSALKRFQAESHDGGKSPLWVSADFRREYHSAQVVKLAIIDSAFEACLVDDRAAAGARRRRELHFGI